jgi:hypothetical protein
MVDYHLIKPMLGYHKSMDTMIYLSKHTPNPQEAFMVCDTHELESAISQLFFEAQFDNFVVEIDRKDSEFMLYVGFSKESSFIVMRDFKSEDRILLNELDCFLSEWFAFYGSYIDFDFSINLKKEDIFYILSMYLVNDVSFVEKYRVEKIRM